MKRLALFCMFSFAASLLASGPQDAQAGNKFNIGGKRTTGRVTVNLNGGAGENPRFRIGGAGGAFDRVNARRFVANNFPVAVGGYGGYFGQKHFGDGGFSNLYNQGFIPVPPYFSLHPPVYYNAPVPRSYGYSPFAYPGTVPTPEVTLGPEEIINPHVEPEEVPEPAQETSSKTAAAPVVIRNPFVESEQAVGFTAEAGEDSSR